MRAAQLPTSIGEKGRFGANAGQVLAIFRDACFNGRTLD